MGDGRPRFPTQHSRDLVHATIIFHFLQSGSRSSARYLFRNEKMGRRSCCNLRHVGDGQDLMGRAKSSHFQANRVGNFTAYVRVNLVKDEQSDEILLR